MQSGVNTAKEQNQRSFNEKGNGKSKATDEARSEEKSMKLGSSEKNEGRVNSNAPKADKELDKWLED